MDDRLARLSISRRQLEIRIQILRVFALVSFRSRALTMEQAIDGVPDALKEAARMEFDKEGLEKFFGDDFKV